MTHKYFGTEGIRGRANVAITPELALRVGQAAGLIFRRGGYRNRVLIGKDTRRSGYMIETALVAGFTSMGMDVLLTGPIPTPAVGMLTRSMRADLGVMIAASHNPFDDNGIKLFGPDGFKLSDEVEQQIEALMDSNLTKQLAKSGDLGRAKRMDGVQDRYIEFAKRTLPRNLSLEGLRVVIDCANGAGYRVAPEALRELDAEVIAIGIALDGDADRVLIVDERGDIVDGDQLLAVIAESWQADGRLAKLGIVATEMSNLRLERYLGNLGLALVRMPVGYVLAHMRSHGYNLGGEPSGHIILSDHTTTGDGLLAALQVLAVVKKQQQPISKVCHRFDPLPQVLKNVRCKDGKSLESAKVRNAIKDGEARLDGHGRLVVRPSGTEPVIRVMGEGDDKVLVEEIVDGIVNALTEAA
jgi:phosphoglucosamine mutase